MLSQYIDAIQSPLELKSHSGPVYASSIKSLSCFQIFCLIFLFSLVMCTLFEAKRPFPIPISLALFSGIVILGLWKVKLSQYSLLTRVMIVIYAMPFVHCFSYLNENIIYADTSFGGRKPNFYQINLEIIKRMTMVGCIGAFGLVAGYLFAGMASNKRPRIIIKDRRCLKVPPFLFVATISLFFSWLDASKNTIFTTGYIMIKSRLRGTEFNSAGLLSFVFTVLLLIDGLNEKRIKIRRLKITITMFTFLTIVILFQFMRGNRDCTGMIIAFMVIYLLNGAGRFKTNKKKFMIAAGLVVPLFLLLQIIGTIRGGFYDTKKIEIKDYISIITKGTWSSILLTPLSVVGDSYYGVKPCWGRTYLDYFLSLPPGLLTHAIGIKRPIDGTGGPAHKMRYGRGGTHVIVVPFMNFKSFGVFFILLLYGSFIGMVEFRMRFPSSIKIKLLYASFFIVSLIWFWYGEMQLVRGIMSFYIVWDTYKLLPKHKL